MVLEAERTVIHQYVTLSILEVNGGGGRHVRIMPASFRVQPTPSLPVDGTLQ